jgi:hypothetical protein
MVTSLLCCSSSDCPVDINLLLVSRCDGRFVSEAEGQVESNLRYYNRRAVEERMAAQRAVTETARAWHSKLAEDFAQRASACTGPICATAILNG